MSDLVQSVVRAMTLLGDVAESRSGGAPVAVLADSCGLNRATAWRLLATLEAYGYVYSDPITHHYTLGLSVPKLAAASTTVGITWQAHAVLNRLSEKTGETADLAVSQGLALTYVAEVTPPAVLQANWKGRTVPLHATSTGKSLLAWLSDAEQDALLTESLPRFTEATITDPDQLRAELARTKERGYAVCAGELEETLFGVSAPVLDRRGRAFAVVSVWGPRSRVPASRFPELGELTIAAAAELAATMTNHSGPEGAS